MPDDPENAMPFNMENANSPAHMATSSGYCLGTSPEKILTGIVRSVEHAEQRKARFNIPDSVARSFADASTATATFHQPSEGPISDLTMTDAPATDLDLLPPSPHIVVSYVLWTL
ncbi:hypothetical protein PENANT_c031G09324 [Penicillium antarcticum]|uniref:Uncharacterized protein n=1 Tax=Penicillium antarcticum TaxID=416450 RepID=A0A1V6PUX6_9EURO|nr:uncharacterized protein N7508_005487 [Penicillium antarcticum]KAJ5306472.1 hypothetical protein N7508_005487 [Penicillium antarcticum]OQD80844.1 hypothetical protein PENANT_c031G09324 [Penicillium antarcticum]